MSQMLLLASDHLSWKDEKELEMQSTQENKVLGKGNSLHKGPRGGKDVIFQNLKTFQCGLGKEEQQGSRLKSGS